MFVSVADLEDTGLHNGYMFEFNEPPLVEQALRLYRNGRLLASSTTEPFLQATVRPAGARYRLERDLDADPVLAMADRSRTRWWFDSAAPADEFATLPLLEVDYDATLGGRNGAVAGQPVTVDLNVHRSQGAAESRVVATYLWFSTDDGGTWTRVRLRSLGPGRYRGVLPGGRLAPGSFVSLRAWARGRRQQPHPAGPDPGVPGSVGPPGRRRGARATPTRCAAAPPTVQSDPRIGVVVSGIEPALSRRPRAAAGRRRRRRRGAPPARTPRPGPGRRCPPGPRWPPGGHPRRAGRR